MTLIECRTHAYENACRLAYVYVSRLIVGLLTSLLLERIYIVGHLLHP